MLCRCKRVVSSVTVVIAVQAGLVLSARCLLLSVHTPDTGQLLHTLLSDARLPLRESVPAEAVAGRKLARKPTACSFASLVPQGAQEVVSELTQGLIETQVLAVSFASPSRADIARNRVSRRFHLPILWLLAQFSPTAQLASFV